MNPGRWVVAGFLLCTVPLAAQAPARRALLIGNSDYRLAGPLRTPVRDAAGLDAVLRKLQFETTVVANATLEQTAAAVEKFAKSLKTGDAAFFYYGGYAVQSNDENYLLPVNFDPGQNREIDYVAYSASRVLADLEARRPGFLAFLIDGAWDSPLLRRRFPQPGLAPVEPRNPGVFLGLSAGTGRWNVDAGGPQSLYASAIATNLERQGLTLSQIADAVKRGVSQASGGRQIPTEVSTVVQDFFINPLPPDRIAWDKLRDSQDRAALDQFRAAFPQSPFAAEAAARIEELDWAAARGKGRAAIEDYLARHPGSRHAADARRELDAMSQAEQAKTSEQMALETLRRFKNAFENRDTEELAKVWPTLTRQQIAGFKAFFRDARSIRVEGQPSTPIEATSGGAVVKVRRSIQYVGQAAQNDAVILRMKRSGDGMIVESVVVER